jgi:hypothetical protein
MSWTGYDNLNMPGEIWKEVAGYEGLYEVSDLGRVRSTKRVLIDKIGRARRYRSKILSGGVSDKGYWAIMLCKDAEQKMTLVARLVATAFIPNPDGKAEVNHKDGNKNDNSVSNLEWMTHQENSLHRNAVLGKNVGEAVHNSTMTNTQVIEIRKMRAETNLSCRAIGERFGVNGHAVYAAVMRRSWKHI